MTLISKIILLVLSAAMLAVVGCVSGNVSARNFGGVEPVFYYLSDWEWTPVTEPEISHWSSKYLADTLGIIDLRNVPQMGVAGGSDQCCMLLASRTLLTPDRSLIYLGVNIHDDILNISAVESRLGWGRFSGKSIAGIVRESFGVKSDPLGVSGVKPLMPSGRKVIHADIGGVRLFTDKLSAGSVEWQKVLAVHRSDYELIKIDAVKRGDELHLKVAGGWVEKYGFDVRTVEQKSDGIRIPETQIGDTFVEAINTALSAHTATGVDGGYGWSNMTVAGHSVQASSNYLKGSTGASRRTRADSDMSCDDMQAEFDVVGSGGTTTLRGTLVRASNSADEGYAFLANQSVTNTYRLYKWVAGVSTLLHQVSDGTPTALPYKISTVIAGDRLSGEIDDIEVINVTDTTFTGQTRAGVYSNDTNERGDNFLAFDSCAATGRIYLFID